MDKQTEKRLIALLDELLEKGDFFHSAIESNDMMFDFEEWKIRAINLLSDAKAQD
ncbi:TPA: hypothetical protein OTY56_001176 [Escherichia coli]|nr:hypothetical protein [Escherichia coli]